jgi:hypothetical protein
MTKQEVKIIIDPKLILKGQRGVYLVICDVKNQDSDSNFEEY